MNTQVTATRTEPAHKQSARIFRPLTDIVETADAIHVTLEMPGVAPENVDIELNKRVLSVHGRVEPATSDQYELVHAEYAEGDYERSFSLSEEFDPDKIEAKVQNGLLTLVLPRPENAKPKRIEVKAA